MTYLPMTYLPNAVELNAVEKQHDRIARASETLTRLGIDPTATPAVILARLSATAGGGHASLLGSSYKCDLGESQGYLTAVQYLSPAGEAGVERWTPCPFASPGCSAGCINNTGQMIYPTHVVARIKRTLRHFIFPEMTADALRNEVFAHHYRAQGQGRLPAARLNGTSDLMWWTDEGWDEVMRLGTQLYDYTKRPPVGSLLTARQRGWHFTFSLNETERSLSYSQEWSSHGVNTAMVVAGPVGSATRTVAKKIAARIVEQGHLFGRPVINGDTHDLRFLDPAVGGWVVLACKGHVAKHDKTGFVVRFDPDVLLGTDAPVESGLLRAEDRTRFPLAGVRP